MKAENLRLNTKWLGRDLRQEETVDSTNDFLKCLARQGARHGTVVLAKEQTGGKGRMGRRWVTPKGSSVAMSCLLRPQFGPEKASMLTLLMGLSVAQACMRLYPLEAWIKWPNDIVVSGKKLCGILTEMEAEPGRIEFVVIGVGINGNFTNFPEDLRDKAVSLQQTLGHSIELATLTAAVLEAFEENYEKFCQTEDLSKCQEQYNRILINRNRQVKVLQSGEELQGVAQGINAQGELLVEKEGRTMVKICAGEVSVRGLDGYV
ncbi:MAG: biotin--[acetyl-CoA-carboxylase] ligase [Lachnospiraceae bacterium]|nr:biotin--[acetyl-CoA-carboxylase] ligase [Lachnospiraceae bacterium]